MRRIDIVIVEGFPLLSLTLVIEPLRLANRESVSQTFLWRLLSPDGAGVRSSSGIPIAPDAPLDQQRADAVILLASYNPQHSLRGDLLSWLRRRAARGELMGCVDSGALIFAAAGLLSSRPAATHHEAIAGYRAEFQDAMFVDRMFDLSATRCSSAGGVATMDMTLALIGHFASPQLAARVAEILNYQPLESESAQGTFGRDWSLPRVDRDLAKCVEVMIANTESPKRIAQIADVTGVPTWRMHRLFVKYLEQPPYAYYLGLRLEKARNMLRNTHATIGDVAALCGFDNLETFSRAYKRRFALPPSRDREWRS